MKEAGVEFNPDSPKQLGDVLFNKLNLRVIKRGKTGPSTDVEVLEKLADEHVVVARLQERLRALVDSYQPGRTDLVRLRADLEDLATRLEEHFRYEERTVVSALNTMGPAPDLT